MMRFISASCTSSVAACQVQYHCISLQDSLGSRTVWLWCRHMASSSSWLAVEHCLAGTLADAAAKPAHGRFDSTGLQLGANRSWHKLISGASCEVKGTHEQAPDASCKNLPWHLQGRIWLL